MNPNPKERDRIDQWLAERALEHQASLLETVALAAFADCLRREAEIALLQRGIIPVRYERNIGTLGIAGQIALLQGHVAIVGAGGLGGWTAEGLCRLGVGKLTLIDGDVYQDSNLNRQLGSDEETLGRSKASTLSQRLQRVNGAVDIVAHDQPLTAANADMFLRGADVVVDALDSIETRLLLQQIAARLDMPMVHGAIAGWTGQVTTILPGDPGLKAIYGTVPVQDHGVETHLGTPSPTPMMISAWLVHECAKLITDCGSLIRGRLLVFDALYGDMTEIRLDETPQ